MENKRKDQKIGVVCNQESHTNDAPQEKLEYRRYKEALKHVYDDYQIKQDNAQANVNVGPSAKISSPSHVDSVHNSNQQQQPPVVQWPYTTQNATEQFLAMHFPNQASPPGALNQWQQLPHPQLFAQSTSPFWQAHPPAAGGGPLLGPNVPTTQTLIPNMGYLCSFSGFPGSWDPTSHMAQLYQMQHPYIYGFPGATNLPSGTPRGMIRPPAKLSQKHQQLWEAQSAENVKLWSVINKLQAEVSDYKDQLKKLEVEVLSLKQKADVPKKAIGTISVGVAQPPKKRGRPRRSVASMDVSKESHVQADGRNHAPSNSLSQSKSPLEKVKSPIFEKVVLQKVENKDMAICFSVKENNVNVLNVVKDVSPNIQIRQSNPIMSAYQGQVQQEYQAVQVSGNGPALCTTSGVNVNFGKDKALKHVYSEISQTHKVLNTGDSVSAKYVGNACNRNPVLASCLPSQDTANVELDVTRQSLFHNGSFIQQVGNVAPGCSLKFANEEDASEDLEDAIEGSTKDENEVMEDDTSSSAAEEILM